jgi:uncharacterized protein (TIGR03437 family)
MRYLFLLLLAVPAFAQPVVLINGFQVPPCEQATAEATFGQLPQKLRDMGREVVYFNSCSVAPASGSGRASLEEIGAALGTRLAALSAPQVDVVMHSMGGLILRAYLSGKQSAPGVFRPPANHKVRKAIFLGTPHFGLGLAQTILGFSGGDPLVRSMLPGSQFLLDLGTWNQGADDLRGVDAVAVIGNVNNGTDGIIPVPSSSISFAAAADRTRVVPYCHTNDGTLALIASGCSRPPYLASVTGEEHLSWRIIRSFLTGTEEWRTLGTAITADPTGSTRGGLVVATRDRDDNPNNSVTAITAGSTALIKVTDFYYAEQLNTGAQSITVNTSAGNLTAPQTISAGLYSVAIVKPGTVAAAITPAAGRVPTRTLAPGMFISLYGASLATENIAAASLPLPTALAGTQLLAPGDRALGLQFAGPTQLNAILPEDASGLLSLTVRAVAGTSKINILIEPAVPAIFTQAGSGTGTASAIQAQSGVVITTQSKARVGDAVSLYLTGLGATETRDGLQWARLQPKLFIGNLEAQILYAGRAPGYAGLDQINFIVPANTPSGDGTPLRVESNGRVSNAVTLPIL